MLCFSSWWCSLIFVFSLEYWRQAKNNAWLFYSIFNLILPFIHSALCIWSFFLSCVLFPPFCCLCPYLLFCFNPPILLSPSHVTPTTNLKRLLTLDPHALSRPLVHRYRFMPSRPLLLHRALSRSPPLPPPPYTRERYPSPRSSSRSRSHSASSAASSSSSSSSCWYSLSVWPSPGALCRGLLRLLVASYLLLFVCSFVAFLSVHSPSLSVSTSVSVNSRGQGLSPQGSVKHRASPSLNSTHTD